ncbi:hypothetical protein J4480_06015 [Candidatus Woesearchaeota archaeon]|nr:hypothetical protein [Candidatus Woesearchaeota archaeon]
MAKKWEFSIIELKRNGRKRYKVTRRMPELHVSDTKVFSSKKKALKQLEEWLS